MVRDELFLKLYYNPEGQEFRAPYNQGFREALEILEFLEDEGLECEKINTNRLTREEISEAYAEAIYPSVRQKFGIRQVFGTRRRSACFFGKEVPALLVYKKGEGYPFDVYPHEKLGKIITIRDYLKELYQELLEQEGGN